MRRHTIRTALVLALLSIIIATPRAQQTTAPAAKESPEDRIALYQALLDLTNPWTVMCIAAHPDDEDGTSLIVMRRKYGAHTESVFSTFGEGGQNAIGPELYEELGAIRARETMAAAEIQGSEPYFLGLKDFGYSKSADETFRVWGHEEGLRRMVLQIRKLRPDVIITNHSVTNNDHGHHQATARLILEAFDAAADSKRFPEQLKDGVTVWQVQRLFVRARGNAGQNPDRQGGGSEIVTIDPNERDPIRGVVYAEEALRALQKHATQGPWPKTFAEFAARFRSFSGQSAAPGQLPLIRYVLVREAKGDEALPKESHNFLDGFRLPERVKTVTNLLKLETLSPTSLDEMRGSFLLTLVNLLKSTPPDQIANGNGASGTLSNDPSLETQRLNRALMITAGISVRLVSATNVLIPGSPAEFSLIISNSNSLELRPNSFFSGVGDDSRHVSLFMDSPSSLTVSKGKTIAVFTEGVPKNAATTIPHSEHLYDQRFAGVPVAVGGLFEFEGVGVPFSGSTLIDVAPPLEIERIAPSLLVLTPKSVNKPLTFTLNLINHENAMFKGALSAQGENLTVSVPAKAARSFQLRLPHGLAARTSVLKFTATGSAAESANVRVVFSNAVVAPNLSVGYIRGFDFSLPNALDALGVESKELSVDEVKTADLQKYSSIIVDNRVYESQPELIAANQRLLDYAKDGGTLIVFYHKSNEWNPDPRRNRPQLAPYKLIVGDERITDENTPVIFLEPQHPLLNFPNKIGPEDFAGWIQERGLYYPRDWDSQYHALLASNDPGEQPLRGGLLVTDYGRGRYIYTSIVWYRQLRAGVPGAYRMLANMISYGHARK
jgi:LmbE family N-acetylglucosaminyl deacetylase